MALHSETEVELQITKAAVQLGLIAAIVTLVLTSNGGWAVFFAVIFVLSIW